MLTCYLNQSFQKMREIFLIDDRIRPQEPYFYLYYDHVTLLDRPWDSYPNTSACSLWNPDIPENLEHALQAQFHGIALD